MHHVRKGLQRDRDLVVQLRTLLGKLPLEAHPDAAVVAVEVLGSNTIQSALGIADSAKTYGFGAWDYAGMAE